MIFDVREIEGENALTLEYGTQHTFLITDRGTVIEE